jgi:hypothetical protein
MALPLIARFGRSNFLEGDLTAAAQESDVVQFPGRFIAIAANGTWSAGNLEVYCRRKVVNAATPSWHLFRSLASAIKTNGGTTIDNPSPDLEWKFVAGTGWAGTATLLVASGATD